MDECSSAATTSIEELGMRSFVVVVFVSSAGLLCVARYGSCIVVLTYYIARIRWEVTERKGAASRRKRPLAYIGYLLNVLYMRMAYISEWRTLTTSDQAV